MEDKPAGKTILVDAFAGVGGNSIAFAMRGGWEMIFGIERDPATLDCARHNAEIYGVENKIVWIQGDCFKEIPKRFAGNDKVVIFASPPWGGKVVHTFANALLILSRYRVRCARCVRSFCYETIQPGENIRGLFKDHQHHGVVSSSKLRSQSDCSVGA